MTAGGSFGRFVPPLQTVSSCNCFVFTFQQVCTQRVGKESVSSTGTERSFVVMTKTANEDKNRRYGRKETGRDVIVGVVCDQRAAYFMQGSAIRAKHRAVQYSSIIAAVFLEDVQTCSQSAEGTICFQTTGLLPGTLSQPGGTAAFSSSSMMRPGPEHVSLQLASNPQ